jgi:prepilin-type N-terminal cleavage/methylation domain-containing protein
MIINFYKKGFTLVELLVVIAIVGLLSTIVLAVTSGVSEQGRIAKGLQFSQHLENSLGAYLVGKWTFDETPDLCGTNNVCDTSGWDNHGTISGAILTDSDTLSGQGKAMSFDGVDDYIDTGGDMVGATAATISAWIYPTGWGGSGNGRIAENGGFSFWLNLEATLLFYDGTQVNSGTDLVLNRWQYVTVTRTIAGITNFYINGALSGAADQNSGAPTAGTNNVIIGNRYNGGAYDRAFNGLIDEIRIYNKALTSFQIKSQYYVGLNRLLAKGLIGEKEYQQYLSKI